MSGPGEVIPLRTRERLARYQSRQRRSAASFPARDRDAEREARAVRNLQGSEWGRLWLRQRRRAALRLRLRRLVSRLVDPWNVALALAAVAAAVVASRYLP